MKFHRMLVLLIALSAPLWSQASAAPVYIESFREGRTEITEKRLDIQLTAEQPVYEDTLLDSSGNSRYKLMILPVRIAPDDPGIISWRVSLLDLKHKFYGNLLARGREVQVTDDPRDQVTWLDPNPYALIPLKNLRVIKVEKFYCTIQVVDTHSSLAPQQRRLQSMTVKIEFMNHNPLRNSETGGNG